MPILRRWLRLPAGRRILALKVTLLLTLVRVALVLVSFRRLRFGLSWLAGRCRARGIADEHYLADLEWAVTAAGRYIVPDRPCLTEALAVQFLLHRRGRPAELCIGVAKDARGRLLAHAWVESEGSVVVGGPAAALEGYRRLASLDGVSL